MSAARQVLDIARRELGVRENPSGSNNVKYNTWYYHREVRDAAGTSYPWCMAFVQWVMAQAGVKAPARTASCGTLMRAAKQAGQWVTGDYQPGDVLIYDFPGGARTDHTGICESADERTVTAIEGNTSVSNASNGGEVRRMRRDVSLVVGAWRPDYEKEADDLTREEVQAMIDQAIAAALPVYGTIEDVPEWYRPTVQKLMDEGAVKGTDVTGTVINKSEIFCQVMTVLDRLGLIE